VRTMLRVSVPVEQGNRAIKDGSLAQTFQSAMQELKAEAAYFLPIDGKRTALIFFDLKDSSDLPRIVEPLFGNLNAAIEMTPAMNADDLEAGFGKMKL